MQSPFQSTIEGIDKLYGEVYEEYMSCLEVERKARIKPFYKLYISRMGYIDELKSQLNRLFNFSNDLLNQSRGKN